MKAVLLLALFALAHCQTWQQLNAVDDCSVIPLRERRVNGAITAMCGKSVLSFRRGKSQTLYDNYNGLNTDVDVGMIFGTRLGVYGVDQAGNVHCTGDYQTWSVQQVGALGLSKIVGNSKVTLLYGTNGTDFWMFYSTSCYDGAWQKLDAPFKTIQTAFVREDDDNLYILPGIEYSDKIYVLDGTDLRPTTAPNRGSTQSIYFCGKDCLIAMDVETQLYITRSFPETSWQRLDIPTNLAVGGSDLQFCCANNECFMYPDTDNAIQATFISEDNQVKWQPVSAWNKNYVRQITFACSNDSLIIGGTNVFVAELKMQADAYKLTPRFQNTVKGLIGGIYSYNTNFLIATSEGAYFLDADLTINPATNVTLVKDPSLQQYTPVPCELLPQLPQHAFHKQVCYVGYKDSNTISYTADFNEFGTAAIPRGDEPSLPVRKGSVFVFGGNYTIQQSFNTHDDNIQSTIITMDRNGAATKCRSFVGIDSDFVSAGPIAGLIHQNALWSSTDGCTFVSSSESPVVAYAAAGGPKWGKVLFVGDANKIFSWDGSIGTELTNVGRYNEVPSLFYSFETSEYYLGTDSRIDILSDDFTTYNSYSLPNPVTRGIGGCASLDLVEAGIRKHACFEKETDRIWTLDTPIPSNPP